MENHTGTHKESTDLMQKRRASLGKRRTETQMHYDFYGPRLWCLGSHVTLRGRPRSFFPLRSSAPARQIYRRGQTEHPKGLPCEARENAPGSSISQSKNFGDEAHERESAHFSGDRCTHPADPLYRRQMPRAPDPHAEFFRTDLLIKRSDMSTWFYYTPFFPWKSEQFDLHDKSPAKTRFAGLSKNS